MDVFTTKPLEGNQLAVFPDGAGLESTLMQALAREMAFPETTFIFPKEDFSTDVRMRIYTPTREIPMAGHPTVGAAFALAHERAIRAGQSRFVFGLGIGPTPVDLEWRGKSLAFAWMTQLRPTFGVPISDITHLVKGLCIAQAEVQSTMLPVQEVSCGTPFVLVPVASREIVDSAMLNLASFQAFNARTV